MSNRLSSKQERRRLASEREERARLRAARQATSTSSSSQTDQGSTSALNTAVQQVILEAFTDPELEDVANTGVQVPDLLSPPVSPPPLRVDIPNIMANPGSRLRYDAAVRQDWNRLCDSFLNEFRDLDLDSQIIGKLNCLRRRKYESLRHYTQRFCDLVEQTDNVGLKQQIEWYVGGLPRKMGIQCCVGPHGSINAVIATAEAYEAARHSEEAPKKKESKGKGVVCAVNALAKELGELKIQMADEKKRRKSPSAPRHGLWCSNCWRHGHSKDDCRMPPAPKSGGQNPATHWVEGDANPDEFFWVDEHGEPLYQSIAEKLREQKVFAGSETAINTVEEEEKWLEDILSWSVHKVSTHSTRKAMKESETSSSSEGPIRQGKSWKESTPEASPTAQQALARTAANLGLHNLEPYTRTLRMANQTTTKPKGLLRDIPTVIGGELFNLTYVVMEPAHDTSFGVLLGRPWMYHACVQEDWKRKLLTFRSPQKPVRKVTLSWGDPLYQGETPNSDLATDDGYSSGTIDPAYRSDHSSIDVYSLTMPGTSRARVEERDDEPLHWECHFLECYEHDEEVLADVLEVKTIEKQGLEYAGAHIHNLQIMNTCSSIHNLNEPA
ncbi:hypothetical protein R1flu_004225 [Riccia fluitans]|uniref:Retrotransposon gag domain-containing protein n=1 Tax=Riccia fluitans TaxID=41844 RepID=A0ABD1YPN3_9MARC